MQQGDSALTIRPDLADHLREHMLGQSEFVSERVAPVLRVNVKGANFSKLDFTEVKTTAPAGARAPGSAYNRIMHATTSDSFTCEEYGNEEPVDDSEAKVLGNYFDAETAAAELAAFYTMLAREVRWVAILFDTATTFASYTTAVSNAWSGATGTPIADVQDAIIALSTQLGGMTGDSRIVGIGNKQVRKDLLTHADITGSRSNIGKAGEEISNADIASILGLDEVHFSNLQSGGAVAWTADKFGVYLVSDSPNIKSTPQCARTFLWEDDSPDTALVESYREEQIRSNIVRVREHVDEKLLTARAGHVLTSV